MTALAYMEFVPPNPGPTWTDYLAELRDVAGRAERATVLVAVEGGRVVGCATVELQESIDGEIDIAPEQANLRMVAVDPAERRRGVGRALVETSLDVARRAGKRLVTLHTTAPMRAAQRMYEAMGFRRDPAADLHFDDIDLHLIAYRMEL